MRIVLTILLVNLSVICFGQRNDSTRVSVFANKFIAAIQSGNSNEIKRLSVSEIYCSPCFKDHTLNYTVTFDRFIKFANEQSLLWNRIESAKPNFQVINFKEQKVYELLYVTTNKDEQQTGHEGRQTILQFVKINEQFKFFGLTSIP